MPLLVPAKPLAVETLFPVPICHWPLFSFFTHFHSSVAFAGRSLTKPVQVGVVGTGAATERRRVVDVGPVNAGVQLNGAIEVPCAQSFGISGYENILARLRPALLTCKVNGGNWRNGLAMRIRKSSWNSRSERRTWPLSHCGFRCTNRLRSLRNPLSKLAAVRVHRSAGPSALRYPGRSGGRRCYGSWSRPAIAALRAINCDLRGRIRRLL